MRYAENVHLDFEQFVEYGRQQVPASALHHNLPWSFQVAGVPVTHETDTCYIVGLNWTEQVDMCPGDILAVEDGRVRVIKNAQHLQPA